MLIHEDYPHTIPTRAYTRWKENYFWVFMDPARDLCCLAHCNTEPALDRAFASFTIVHKGETLVSAKEVPMPTPFEHQKELRFGNILVRFVEPQAKFQVSYEDDKVSVVLDLTARMDLFDFQACADVNPDSYTISDNVAFERGAYRHQGQCLTGTGRVSFKGGETVTVDGMGYRDHSWGFRNDALTLDHNWSFFNFPTMGFHLMRVRNAVRPEISTKEGYAATRAGNQVLRELSFEDVGDGPEGMPEQVIYRTTAYDGTPYTLIADVGKSFARLPLHSQKPGQKTAYFMIENMCPCRCVETGEEGFANVEIGHVQQV